MPVIGGLTVPMILDTLGFSEGAENATSVLSGLGESVQEFIDQLVMIDEAARESFRALQAAADAFQMPVDQLVGSGSITAAMQEAEKAASRLGMEWNRFTTTLGAMTVTPQFSAIRGMAAEAIGGVTDLMQSYNDLVMGNADVAESFKKAQDASFRFSAALGGPESMSDLRQRLIGMATGTDSLVNPFRRFMEAPAERDRNINEFNDVMEDIRGAKRDEQSMRRRIRSENRRAVQVRIDR